MSFKTRGWRLFDALIEQAERRPRNPWVVRDGSLTFEPDLALLRRLLAVPIHIGASSQTGVPALAFDVWTSYEFRRAGFDPDAIWPRSTPPRVLPGEIARLVQATKGPLRRELDARIAKGGGLRGAVSADAHLLGKNYVKQVDVGMSSWHTGPELMVSTKRMDASFGKNAANRVEESYGDAKNLRLRHPEAALGFVYGLRSTALVEEPAKAAWLIDLLGKLGRADDAYDAVALLIPVFDETLVPDSHSDDEGDQDDPLVAAGLKVAGPETDTFDQPRLDDVDLLDEMDVLPEVDLDIAAVPAELAPERFFRVMTDRILDNSPITFHREARERRTRARAD